MKTLFRWILRLGCVGLIILLSLWFLKVKSDRSFYTAYDSDAPLNARTLSQHTQEELRSQEVIFEGVDGMPVPLISFYPVKQANTPLPCVIFLHGIGQSKSFLEIIAPYFTKHGYAIVCFDQYTRGERRLAAGTNPISKGLAIRRRAALTVMETRRLVDYLQSNAEISSERIYLVGASFGAMMGTIVAAQEPRVSATALIYGGGGWSHFGDSKIIREELGNWTSKAVTGAAFLMAPADPLLFAGKLTSRPLLIQNGTRDSIIPQAAAEALIETAGKQAEVIWYDSDHVGLDKKHVKVVLNDVLSWLDRVDR